MEQQAFELVTVGWGVVDPDEGDPVPHGGADLGGRGLELELREGAVVEHLEDRLEDVFDVLAEAAHQYCPVSRLGGRLGVEEMTEQEGLAYAVFPEHLDRALPEAPHEQSGFLLPAVKAVRGGAPPIDRDGSRNDGRTGDLDLVDDPADDLGLIDEVPNGDLS